jgi:hypothetical protein
MNECLNCKKEVSEKATYCSDKCRIAYTRKLKKGVQPEQPKVTRTFDFKPTRTDAKFEANKPNYYNYGALHKSKCQECSAEFKTRMDLLRFCSPQHMEAALKSLSPL